ncbi:hypothetical protein BO85DRAFT_477408 [Aspergillus piperis CBS 112811]|uniref:Uncharacterized protein n=1 Tax=Aspergillus piperis CBS 112811 TaxID=1448313 RepID=A0A8G1R5W7_9EURO|nr:hypothetical protein BO85DRAFT_477408 [Aspergillus piperis CBS 112811]RAH58814.1 hypothetical protein BO85DRAFT_477408 [Aspergillus piperis CBS 112811]
MTGHTPIMHILLAKGGTLGLQGKFYPSTPLIEAVSGGHIGMRGIGKSPASQSLDAVALYVRKTVTVGRYGYVELRDIVRILLAAGAMVVLDVGHVEIVDVLEVLHRGRQSRPRPVEINGDDEAEGGLFDDDDADDEHAKQVKAYARDTFADLQRAMGQQYESGALGVEETKYVEAVYYGQAKA